RLHWVPRSKGSEDPRTLGGVERVCDAGGAEGGEGAGGAGGASGADGIEGAEGSRFEGGVGAEQGWAESTWARMEYLLCRRPRNASGGVLHPTAGRHPRFFAGRRRTQQSEGTHWKGAHRHGSGSTGRGDAGAL